MKKYLIFATVVALGLVACNKEQVIDNPVNQDEVVMLTFTSQKPALNSETKTQWDGSQSIIWSSKDKIRVGYTKDGYWMGKTEAGSPKFYASGEVSIGSDAHIGTFIVPVGGDNFTDPGVDADYVFYGVYPQTSGEGTNFVTSGGIATLTLPATQTPGVNTFDKSADIMIGNTATISSAGIPTDPIEISWNRLVGLADITFTSFAFDGVEEISEITLTSSGKIAGTFTADLVNGDITSVEDAVNSIVLKGDNLTVDGSSVEAWCGVLPGSFTSINVVVKTNKATYTKNITGISGKAFQKNARNKLTIKMSGADRQIVAPDDYTLYSGALTEGDYIIYYDGNIMHAEISGDRFTYSSVTPLNNTISTNDESVIWHIAASGSYYTIYNEATSMYAASTGAKSKAQLLSDGTDNKSLWTVTGDDTYDFVNKQNTTNSVNATLRFNAGYGFACYSTETGGALSLYKKDTRTPLNAPSTVTASLNATSANAIDVTFDDSVTDADKYLITATPTAGGDVIVKDNVYASPATIDGLAYSTEYSISVYAVPESSDTGHRRSVAKTASSAVTTGAKPVAPAGYELITTLEELVTGVYVVVGKTNDIYYAMPEVSTGKISGVEVSVSDGFITKAVGDNYALNISKNSSGNISIGDGTNYLQIKTSGTDFGTTTTEQFYPVSASGGIFAISNTRYLAWRGGSYLQFGNYASITGEYSGVYLFKYNRDPDPIINASTTKAVGYNEDTFDIPYTISNAVTGKSLSANKNVSWISNIVVGASSVEFDVAANTGDERTGTITLSYDGAVDVLVTVTQAAFPGYTFTLTGVTDDKVYVGGAEADDIQITASSALAWTATPSFETGLTDSFEIDPASGSAGETVTMTIMAAVNNTTGAARKLGTITLNNGQNTTIEVWQNGVDEPKNYVDVITSGILAATSTSYVDFSGVSYSGTGHSDAVYAGNSAKDGSDNIQLRSKNSNSGIVSTTSGGKVKSVKITVGSGTNTIDVYGSNTAYTGASSLYSSSTQGTKLGSVTATGTITVTGDYQYIGIRSNSGAIYVSSIEITWEK